MKINSKFFLLIMVMLLSFSLAVSCDKEKNNGISEETNSEAENSDRMIMVNGKLYRDTGYVDSCVECGTADGEILTSVSETETPKKDKESNFGEGYPYQLLYESHVIVNINRKWIIFQDVTISEAGIPDTVANFLAEVSEASDNSLLVNVNYLPKNFRWIFDNQRENMIKPISINIENLAILENGNEISPEELIGKTVKVWFDGAIKTENPEMSSPTELGEVYKVEIFKKD
ncbi:MAG: hypothetical protein CSB16_01140 [Clostridiales bacterium]|nr:MAG: hypothetical protein CSB16_01140 [Clostridiales bacterium]